MCPFSRCLSRPCGSLRSLFFIFFYLVWYLRRSAFWESLSHRLFAPSHWFRRGRRIGGPLDWPWWRCFASHSRFQSRATEGEVQFHVWAVASAQIVKSQGFKMSPNFFSWKPSILTTLRSTVLNSPSDLSMSIDTHFPSGFCEVRLLLLGLWPWKDDRHQLPVTQWQWGRVGVRIEHPMWEVIHNNSVYFACMYKHTWTYWCMFVCVIYIYIYIIHISYQTAMNECEIFMHKSACISWM